MSHLKMPQRIDEYAQKDVTALYQDFDIGVNGYSAAQITASRAHFGSNILCNYPSDTVCYRLRRAFVTPFTMILFVLALISFVTDVLLPSNFSRNITTVAIILAMLVTSGIIRFIQEMRAKHVADALKQILTTTAEVYRDGQWQTVPAKDLVVGDTVRLNAGDRVPADIRLTHTNGLFLSQAIITGESAILPKNSQSLPPKKQRITNDYDNIAFMGTTIIGGHGKGVILAVGTETLYGSSIAHTMTQTQPFDQGANAIAQVLIRFMAVLVPLVFLTYGLTHGNWVQALLFALSVAVGLTPEMLPMVVNACLAKGSASMRHKQTVVKNINAMQGFGSMDVLCVDKTGTLTGNHVLLEYYMDVLGNESNDVLQLAYLNSYYQSGITNSLDSAILKSRDMPGCSTFFDALTAAHPQLDAAPFDHQRQCASVLVKERDHNKLIVKGSVDAIYRRCTTVDYHGQCHPITADDCESVHAIVDEMENDGMKVLALAYKNMAHTQFCAEDEKELTLLGYLAFFDAPKASAKDAIKKLKARHVGIRVLTGDQKRVAVSICTRLGIPAEHILTGNELNDLNEDAILRIERTTVFAELSPAQKAQVVETLRANGHTVGFLGDGLNDLAAMQCADVSISVDTAAEAVRESADVMLLKKDLAVLEAGIVEGRKAFANMSKYIRITASSNFGNILSIVVASVFLPFFPMTAVQLLLLNLLYDTLCLVLPWDRVDNSALSQPLEWSGRTLGRFMRTFGPVSSIFDICTFIFLFFIFCPAICGQPFSALTTPEAQSSFIALFQTGWFLESMWTQILILHLLRTQNTPLLQSHPSRAVMLVTICGIVCFTALTLTPFGNLIGLTALPASYFGYLIMVVMLYLLLVTWVKKWYLKRYHSLL